MIKRVVKEVDGGVGLVIPPTLATQLDLEPGTLLNISRQNNALVIRKRSARGRRDGTYRKLPPKSLRTRR